MSQKRRRGKARIASRHHAPRTVTHDPWRFLPDHGQESIVRLFSDEISCEGMADPRLASLPAADQGRIATITEGFHRASAEHVRPLEQLVADLLHLPKLQNHFACAYETAGMHVEAHQLNRDRHRRFPDYLFALAAYASC